MPVEGKRETGDHILEIDGQTIHEADDLIDYIEQKQAGDQINLEVVREDETLHIDLTLDVFPNMDNKVGMGIELVTNRSVSVQPELHFSSGNIGEIGRASCRE